LPLSRLLEYDKANAQQKYTVSFSTTEKQRDWRPNTYIKTSEHIKTSIFEIGTIEIEAESISDYDLVAQI
jgi:hypothetical protein